LLLVLFIKRTFKLRFNRNFYPLCDLLDHLNTLLLLWRKI
jgi:hypothetical protein